MSQRTRRVIPERGVDVARAVLALVDAVEHDVAVGGEGDGVAGQGGHRVCDGIVSKNVRRVPFLTFTKVLKSTIHQFCVNKLSL